MNKRKIGELNEEKAITFMVDNGYKIIDKNFYSKNGEIDIIALKEKYICFVEVKYRKDLTCGSPEESVTLSKMRKICKASMYYLYTHNEYSDFQIRYDVVALTADKIAYYENAFPYIG